MTKFKLPTYKERQEFQAFHKKKREVKLNFSRACIGDVVVYASHSRTGELRHSGTGIVVNMILENDTTSKIVYFIEDSITHNRIEVMSGCMNMYEKDFVEIIEKGEYNMFYSGYDKLTNQIIPNTMAKFERDAESLMTAKFGINWKEDNSFYEVRLVEVKVLNTEE